MAGDHELMPQPGADPAAAALAALAEYDLGELTGLEELPAGSLAGRKVLAAAGTFVLKPAARHADVELQARISGLLTAQGLRQARVMPTSAGALVTCNGYVLLEYLEGSAPLHPSPAQTAAAMRHVAEFHQALGRLPVRYAPDPESLWVRVADPEHLVTTLPRQLAELGMASADTQRAIAILDRARGSLAALPRQLVHGDLGPDNVLMDGDEVVSVIDFTPYWDSVLFAACGALYWYHVRAAATPDLGRLQASLAAMDAARPWSAAEQSLWPAGLIREALRRLATPLELARVQGSAPGPSTGPRLDALRAAVRLCQPHCD